MTDTPDHVALLTVDALRADHLSEYGYERETTPTLDRLAQRGVRFEAAYSQSSHTREAIPAMLSGRHPDEAVGADYRLAADTVATRLAAASVDVSTAGFHSNPFVSRAYGFGDDFDRFDDDLHLGNHKILALAQRLLDKLRNRHYARAETINDRALSWLDAVSGSWFLWTHYMDVHGPYEPPAEYQRRFHDEVVDDRTAQDLYKRAIADPDSISSAERETLLDLYDAEIRYVDDAIGTFVNALDDRGLLSETLVIVTADHGDAFGEHGYYEHPRYLHDELVEVPMIAFGAGIGAEAISVPVGTVDLVPTILAAFDLATDELPGVPLQEVVAAPGDYTDRVIYSQARGENEDDHLRRFSARNGAHTCYLEREIETGGVVSRDRNGAPRDLLDALETFSHGRTGGTRSESLDDGETDASVEERLEALGYKER